jgi:hypothetical protein
MWKDRRKIDQAGQAMRRLINGHVAMGLIIDAFDRRRTLFLHGFAVVKPTGRY